MQKPVIAAASMAARSAAGSDITRAATSDRLRIARRILVPAAVVALLLVAGTGDHFFRDEFYYLACADRLAWGYVDQPPFSIAVLWILRHLAGESLFVLRTAAALTLGATVWLTGCLARRLGAAEFGQTLAMLGMAASPAFLAVGSYYSMNVFDVLLWTATLLVVVDLIEEPSTAREEPSVARWALAGLLLGLGLLNKVSVLWLGAGLGAGLLLTPARRRLLTAGPYLTGVVAAAWFLPHVVWQAATGWPTLEFIREASRNKMLEKTPWAFLGEQVLNMHPVTLSIWVVGLVGLLAAPRLRRVRGLAVIYLTVLLILVVNGTSRSGYLLPAYPPLMAAGAVLWESWLARPGARRAAVTALVSAGVVTAPLAVPLLSVERYVRYASSLGIAPSTEEKKDVGRLPQFFADRQGWDRFVGQVGAAWDRLTPEERRVAAVFTENYGEAGAIETLGRSHGMVAISGHNNYWLWGPGEASGQVLLVLSRDASRLEPLFASVQLVDRIACGDCMPYENGLGLYLCRDLHQPLSGLWPRLKHYD